MNGGVENIDLVDSERVLNEANSHQRVNWSGVSVGLVTRLAFLITLGALGAAIGVSAVNDLGTLGVGAAIWAALTLLISAYMAGFTAVRAGNQGLATRGQFTGLVTGMLMTLGLTLVLSNLVSGLVGTASNVIGSVATGTATATAAANNPGTQAAASSLVSGLNADSIGQIIGQASPDLSDAQSTTAAKVVSGIITRASNDLGNVTNLRDFVKNRVDNIQKALSGPEFVTRLH